MQCTDVIEKVTWFQFETVHISWILFAIILRFFAFVLATAVEVLIVASDGLWDVIDSFSVAAQLFIENAME